MGFAPHFQGALAECDDTPGEPTMPLYGQPFPVGCTNPLQTLTTTDGTGHLITSFTIRTGTLGPPAAGVDSAKQDATHAAGKYPCPPTSAQIPAGSSCKITYIDALGERASATITFATSDAAPATAPAGGAVVQSGPGAIPFSGFGTGLWRLNQIGGVLVCVGCALILFALRARRVGLTKAR
jgi:hypothetical protein